jgi:uncharacterized delta-60 repeat protein
MTPTKISRRIRRRPQVELLEGRYLLNAGALDTTFGGTGMVTGPLGGSEAVAVQSDSKVVVAGSGTASGFTIARYNADGSLDSTFGSGGVKAFPISNSPYPDAAYAVAIQSDGKIVAAGQVLLMIKQKKGYSTPNYWAVIRLNTNGTPDSTFGGGTGYVLTPVNTTSSPSPAAIAFQSDSKIVVGGLGDAGQNGTLNEGLAVVRYNSDGSLDTTFGTGGKIINTTINSATTNGQMLSIDSSGRIDVAGSITATGAMAVERFLSNGSPDSTFGSGGVASLVPPGTTGMAACSLGLQSTGKIVVYGRSFGGQHGAMPTLLRFNTDGSLDTTFGTGGVYIEPRLFHPFAMVVQPSNDEIVATGTPYPYSPQFAVTRVLADGSSVDTGFGTNGIGVTAFANSYQATPYSLQLAPDGKIAVTGQFQTTTQPYFAVARFLGDSTSAPALVTSTATSSAPRAIAPDPAAVPLVLDDSLFLSSITNRKHHRATPMPS